MHYFRLKRECTAKLAEHRNYELSHGIARRIPLSGMDHITEMNLSRGAEKL